MISWEWKSFYRIEKSHNKYWAILDPAPGEEMNAGPGLQKVWGLTVERHRLLIAKQMRTQTYELTIMTYVPWDDWSMDKESQGCSSQH